jgi:hypothetical protein
MIGHFVAPAHGRLHPAWQSAAVIEDLLRKDLGFHGLVVSDDLEMAAAIGKNGKAGTARVAELGRAAVGYSYPMTRRRLIVLVLVVAASCAALAASGCAGELPVKGQSTSTISVGPTTSTTEPARVELARQVAATWAEAIQKLIPLLQGTPPLASIQPQVTQLKEEYVQKLFALGRQIAALSADDQQAVYDRTMDILSSDANTDWFTNYSKLYDQYAAGSDQASQDFAVLLSTFNMLTEYSFFDVLKAEDPDEATRLGVQ